MRGNGDRFHGLSGSDDLRDPRAHALEASTVAVPRTVDREESLLAMWRANPDFPSYDAEGISGTAPYSWPITQLVGDGQVTLDEARERIDSTVVYQANYDGAPIEQGVITSVNESFVFVRYGSKVHTAATRPEDLRFVS